MADSDSIIRLDEEALNKDPAEVFEILEKLGEGCGSLASWSLTSRAYGSVFKGVHRHSGKLIAIKQVVVDSDLQVWWRHVLVLLICRIS
jgi:hypothetical protein